jgi:hypothetical protein
MAVWHVTVGIRPLFVMADAFDVLRAHSVKQKRQWDVAVQVSPEHRSILKRWASELAFSGAMSWSPRATSHMQQRVTIAGDASDLAAGAVVCDGRNAGRFMVRRFDDRARQAHIFIKELLACLWTLEIGLSAGWFQEGDTIEYLGDNRAAMYATRRFYSRNKDANDIVRRIFAFLEEHHLTLVCEPISSIRNPADEPSRGRRPQKNKIANALIVERRVVARRSSERVEGDGLDDMEQESMLRTLNSLTFEETFGPKKGGSFFDEIRDGTY